MQDDLSSQGLCEGAGIPSDFPWEILGVLLGNNKQGQLFSYITSRVLSSFLHLPKVTL